MALVKLKRDWYAPNGQFFRESRNPNEVAESMLDELPSDAEILGEDGAAKAARKANSVKASKESVADMKKTATAFKD